jgi:hypothetical protein
MDRDNREALTLGWRVVARCVRGREDGPSSRSSRECTYRRELDIETLVCTRGRLSVSGGRKARRGTHQRTTTEASHTAKRGSFLAANESRAKERHRRDHDPPEVAGIVN